MLSNLGLPFLEKGEDTMIKGVAIGVLLFLMLCFGNSAVAEEGENDALTLKESIAIAFERSAFLHSAQQEVRGAEYRKKAAIAEFLPKAKTGYSYTRLNEPGEFKQGELDGREITVTTVPEDNYSWTFQVEQPLFVGGALLTNYKLTKLGIDIAKIQEAQTELDLILQVKEAYFSILKAEKLLDVARQTEKQIREHLDVAQAFYSVGMTPRNDVLEAQVELANATQDLITAENNLKIAQARFNTVLRRAIDEPVNLADVLSYTPYDQDIESCIGRAYEKRPEILEANKNIERHKEEVSLTKSDFLPDCYLTFDYERQGDDMSLDGTFTQDPENWQVIASLEWTFWEWGKTSFETDDMRVRVLQSEDALIQIRDDVVFEVKEAFLKLHEAEKNIFVAKTSIEQAEENYRMNEARYKEQIATSTDVLDAQVLLTKSQTNYYNALSDYNIAHARLNRAMGVGFVAASTGVGNS